jgi:hypothetical protein
MVRDFILPYSVQNGLVYGLDKPMRNACKLLKVKSELVCAACKTGSLYFSCKKMHFAWN